MKPGLDGRGACDFIRPLHYAMAASAAILSTIGLAVAVSRVSGLSRSPGPMGMLYVSVFIVVWMILTPLADKFGVAWQRQQGPLPPGDDQGYGWFYWDDSGMGNYPTPFFGHFLYAAFLSPFSLLPLIAVPFVILRFYPQAKAEDRKREQGATDRPL
jgi:hypothetical protein